MSVIIRCGGTAATEKRFIAASSGAKVIVAEERDGWALYIMLHVHALHVSNDRRTFNNNFLFAHRKTGLITLNSNGSTVDSVKNATESVVAMTVSCRGQLLAACTSEKRLVVWESDKWRVIGER